jgi:hypothetical protein
MDTSTSSDPLPPVIEQASAEGRLAVADIGDLYSATGIALPDRPEPVVATYLAPRSRGMRIGPTVQGKIGHDRLTALRGNAVRPQFEGGEHTAIGDQVVLYFSAGDPGTAAFRVPLHLPNGLALTYGQIVALGGDFYGIPDAPISDGATDALRQQRFTNAYASLAVQQASRAEAMAILEVMQIEIKAVNKALANGESPAAAYKALGDTLSAQWNRITGGGSVASPWVPPGRYLQLSATNWDHFSRHAVLAYSAGHAVAIDAAVAAGRLADAGQRRVALERAYAMNAFADHFLTDVFSSGHMRSPRKELNDLVLAPAFVTGLLTRFMHDEDCANGLYVENRAGNRWKAYGDKNYFAMVDITNAILVNGAAQLSADDVFASFIAGTPVVAADYAALQFIPDLARLQDYKHLGKNYAPMFVAANQTVLKRNDLNNPQDASWTDDWWGNTTLTWLEALYEGPVWQIGPMKPPASGPAVAPNGWQTDKPIPPNWVKGNQVRYCVTFVDGLNETAPGPWGAFYTLGNQFLPTLQHLPRDPTGSAKARNVYRQFVGKPFAYVGTVEDNTTTQFIDRMH